MIFSRLLFLAALCFVFAACQPKRAADGTQTPTSDDARQEFRSQELLAPTGRGQNTQPSSLTSPITRDEAADKNASPPPSRAEASGKNIISQGILDRKAQAREVEVQHILISWSDLESAYAHRGGQDRRGTERSKDEADALTASILEDALQGESFEALMRKHSEDPSTAKTGRPDAVTQDALLLEEFKTLALRLKMDETGVVQSRFGYHILHRVK